VCIEIMSAVHLSSVDLNLLVVLDALLETRSTTLTAKRLGRTQPAMSHALRRLRAALEDPLFVRSGSALEPTSFALSLAAPLRRIITGAEAIFRGGRGAVEPGRLERTFRVGGSDVFGIAILPHLVQRLGRVAPRVDIDVRPSSDATLETQLERRQIDAAFGTRFRSAGVSATEVGTEDMVILLRKGHPALAKKLDIDVYCALDHVVVTPRGTPGSAMDSALDAIGRARRVALRVPHFSAAVLVVSRSDLITTLPRSFARAFRALVRFETRELPVESPIYPFQIAVAKARAGEPEIAWLADELVNAARQGLDSRGVGGGRRVDRRAPGRGG
jgi:DNA-binding transcriptional LysR family regulator